MILPFKPPVATAGIAYRPLYDGEKDLAPASPERLKQIIARLMLHYPCPEGVKQHRLFAEYIDRLASFPEDLLCAAYHHVLRHHAASVLPSPAALMAIMEPELHYRQNRKRELALDTSEVDA